MSLEDIFSLEEINFIKRLKLFEKFQTVINNPDLDLASKKEILAKDLDQNLSLILNKTSSNQSNQQFCPYYQIKQCNGICGGHETLEQYAQRLEQIKKVLQGNLEEVKNWLKDEILKAAKISNFELAAIWRDKLSILDNIFQEQKIVLPQPQNIDLVTLVIKQDASNLEIGSIFVQQIRQGRLINVNNFLLSGSYDDEENNLFQQKLDGLDEFDESDDLLNSENLESLEDLRDNLRDNEDQILETETKIETKTKKEKNVKTLYKNTKKTARSNKLVLDFLLRFFKFYSLYQNTEHPILIDVCEVEKAN